MKGEEGSAHHAAKTERVSEQSLEIILIHFDFYLGSWMWICKGKADKWSFWGIK